MPVCSWAMAMSGASSDDEWGWPSLTGQPQDVVVASSQGREIAGTYKPVIPGMSTSRVPRTCRSAGVREGSHFVSGITSDVVEAADLEDAVGAVAGHLGAPAVEGPAPPVGPEEGRERTFLLERVRPVHP